MINRKKDDRNPLYEKFKSAQKENERLVEELQGKRKQNLMGGVKSVFGSVTVYGPYVIEEQEFKLIRYVDGAGPDEEIIKEPYIVENHDRAISSIEIDQDEPDLFIRFIELPGTEKAYLGFAKKYGLLGLHDELLQEYQQQLLREDSVNIRAYSHWFLHNKERISLIKQFHKEIKSAFEQINAHINGTLDDTQDLTNWFDYHFTQYVKFGIFDLSGNICLYGQGLVGELILQLYRFLVNQQVLRVCALPGCEIVTTRKKFCSLKHQRLFNIWKLRKKIVEINGVWQVKQGG